MKAHESTAEENLQRRPLSPTSLLYRRGLSGGGPRPKDKKSGEWKGMMSEEKRHD